MSCNSAKYKELVLRKSGHDEIFMTSTPIMNIGQCNKVKILGITFQSNGKFTKHMALRPNSMRQIDAC